MLIYSVFHLLAGLLLTVSAESGEKSNEGNSQTAFDYIKKALIAGARQPVGTRVSQSSGDGLVDGKHGLYEREVMRFKKKQHKPYYNPCIAYNRNMRRQDNTVTTTGVNVPSLMDMYFRTGETITSVMKFMRAMNTPTNYDNQAGPAINTADDIFTRFTEQWLGSQRRAWQTLQDGIAFYCYPNFPHSLSSLRETMNSGISKPSNNNEQVHQNLQEGKHLPPVLESEGNFPHSLRSLHETTNEDISVRSNNDDQVHQDQQESRDLPQLPEPDGKHNASSDLSKQLSVDSTTNNTSELDQEVEGDIVYI